MRTYTTKHTVYKLNELSDEAREKAIEKHRELLNDIIGNELLDEMEYRLDELLKQYKIKPINTQIRYSLSYCQGDGASFTGDIEYKAYRGNVVTNGWGNHYEHWNSVDVGELTSKKTDKDAPERVYDELNNIVHNIGKELEKLGYSVIDDS